MMKASVNKTTQLPARVMLTRPKAEGGSALVVAIVLLLVMSIIGVSTVNLTGIQSKLAANLFYYQQAFSLSQAEIDAQIARINQQRRVEFDVSAEGADHKTKNAIVSGSALAKVDSGLVKEQSYSRGPCIRRTGNSGGGITTLCYEYRLFVNSQVDNTRISSNQVQSFEVEFLEE